MSLISALSGADTPKGFVRGFETQSDLLQGSFTNFAPLNFQKSKSSYAPLQRLKMSRTLVGETGSRLYTGFRFTIPEWIDGDLEWMFFDAPTKAQAKLKGSHLAWYIVAEKGSVEGFDQFFTGTMTNYPWLRAHYPYHRNKIFYQTLPQERLRPGESYAIWFSVPSREVSDLVLALTIKSKRGHKEFGKLPWR